MKGNAYIIFVVSGVLPATVLMVMNFIAIIQVFMGDNVTDEKFLMLFMSILGILGYIGLILLLLSHRFTPIKIILFLLSGIIFFVIFISIGPDNSWEWVFTMKEPRKWFLLVWPTIVSLVGIINLLTTQRKVKKVFKSDWDS